MLTGSLDPGQHAHPACSGCARVVQVVRISDSYSCPAPHQGNVQRD